MVVNSNSKLPSLTNQASIQTRTLMFKMLMNACLSNPPNTCMDFMILVNVLKVHIAIYVVDIPHK